MLKGYQRQMIVMRTEGGSLFEAAYFILRREQVGAKDSDMLQEANRLIHEGGGYVARRAGERRARRLWAFLAGMLIGGAVVLLLWVLIGR